MQEHHEVKGIRDKESEKHKLTELTEASREISQSEKIVAAEKRSIADTKVRQLIEKRKEIPFKGGLGCYELEVSRGQSLIDEGERLKWVKGKRMEAESKIKEGKRIIAEANRKKNAAIEKQRQEQEKRERERRERERKERERRE